MRQGARPLVVRVTANGTGAHAHREHHCRTPSGRGQPAEPLENEGGLSIETEGPPRRFSELIRADAQAVASGLKSTALCIRRYRWPVVLSIPARHSLSRADEDIFIHM